MKKIIFLIPFVFFVHLSVGYTEDIYKYTDEKGIVTLSNTPIPDKYEMKAERIDSYNRDSPAEIQRYQETEKAKEQGREAEINLRRQINRAQEDADRIRRQEAEKQKAKEEIRCYTYQEPGHVSGGVVSGGIVVGGVVHPGKLWYICKDKNGKIVSKERQ